MEMVEDRPGPPYHTALMIGVSIAGSSAAHVLADHFERVVVLDRDQFPGLPGRRKGAPHSDPFHAVLSRGLTAVKELFPGFTDEAVTRTAEFVSYTEDMIIQRRASWAPRFTSDLHTLFLSRGLLEWMVRNRVSMQPHVNFIEQA